MIEKIDDLMRLYRSAIHKVTPKSHTGRQSKQLQTESYRTQRDVQPESYRAQRDVQPESCRTQRDVQPEYHGQSYGSQQDIQSASSNNEPYDSWYNAQSPSSYNQ